MKSSPDQLPLSLDLATDESRNPPPTESNPFLVEYVDPWTQETVSLKVKRPDDLPRVVDRLRRKLRSPLPIAVSLVGPSGDALTVGIDDEIGFAYYSAPDPRKGINRAALGNGTRGGKFSIFGAPSPLAAKWMLPKAAVIQAMGFWVSSGGLDPALEWLEDG
jgi:hypothetical protein